MHFQKILPDSEQFIIINNLYESSFPIDERRDYENFINILNTKSNIFSLEASVTENGEIIGFISHWDFEDFIYIEHFTVDEALRGHGYGREIIESFMSRTQLPIILEVELPDCEMSIRRIKFYERLGFKLHNNVKYIQPSYGQGRKEIELKLMTYGKIDIVENCHQIEMIKKEVYDKQQ
ncbi:MAG: GNAT family N-acetyltransferase [Muribaculaceae bacterium]